MLRVKAPVRYVGEVRYLLIAVAAALVISGCGAYRTGSGSNPSPTPSEGTGLGYDLVVTEKDRTATMRVGQKVEVVFHAASNMDNWTQVRSTNESARHGLPDVRASGLDQGHYHRLIVQGKPFWTRPEPDVSNRQFSKARLVPHMSNRA